MEVPFEDDEDDDDDEFEDDDDFLLMAAEAMGMARGPAESAEPVSAAVASTNTDDDDDDSGDVISPFDVSTLPKASTTTTDKREFNKETVDQVLDEVRPYLISDGGNVSVERVDEVTRNVYLILEGACGSCPSSTVTMQMGIERVLKENFENLGEVVRVEDEEDKPTELSYLAVEAEMNRIQPAMIAMGAVTEIVSVDPIGVVEMKFRGSNKVRQGLELALMDIDFVKHVKFVMDD
jgi:Fe-S cluster biogenesis protein NfuA